MKSDGPILELKNVVKRFSSPGGDVTALRGVSLEIRPGELVALTGPSGSGKTTLLNLASLLDYPTGGTVRFAGMDTDALPPRELARLRCLKMGMVFQRFHLLTRRTALENVMFRFRYTGECRRTVRERSVQALERVGLAHLADRTVRLLSGGEMQRVAVARAMAEPPLVLFADEPTGNLDADNTAMIMALFADIGREGVAVVLATHNVALLPYCTRHLRCEQGLLREHPVADAEATP